MESESVTDSLKSTLQQIVLALNDLACFWFMLLPFVIFKNIESPTFFKTLGFYGVYLFGMSAFRGAFCSRR